MTRILTPADYGLVGMLTIFMAVSQSLVDSGFSQALIRKQNRTEIDNSTVFYFNIGVGIILYAVLFFCSPLIARFYNEPLLTVLTRFVGLGLIFNSLNVVQRALFTINLDFRTQAKASLSAAIISGVVGLSMAYTGWGVWAIVAVNLTAGFVNTFLFWILSNWRPRLVYSWKSFKEMFGFGSKLAASGLINTIYNNIYLIVIGKIFKASDLGYFTRAQGFSSFASTNVTGILQRVSYPVLCKIQDDITRLRGAYRRLLKTSAFLIFPLMVGMAAVSRPMILTVLSDKWLFSATLLIPICLAGMWYPIHAINLNLLQVSGKSELFLRLEIIKKCLGIGILCITIPLGLYVMCWGMVVGSLVALVINTYYTGKIIELGFLKQMKDLFPILVLSLVMGGGVFCYVTFVPMPQWVLLISGIAIGVLVYAGIARLFRFPELKELLDIIHRR